MIDSLTMIECIFSVLLVMVKCECQAGTAFTSTYFTFHSLTSSAYYDIKMVHRQFKIWGLGANIYVGVNQTLATQSQKQEWDMANIVNKTTIDPRQQVIAQIRNTTKNLLIKFSSHFHHQMILIHPNLIPTHHNQRNSYCALRRSENSMLTLMIVFRVKINVAIYIQNPEMGSKSSKNGFWV